jgi:hypothetical protein
MTTTSRATVSLGLLRSPDRYQSARLVTSIDDLSKAYENVNSYESPDTNALMIHYAREHKPVSSDLFDRFKRFDERPAACR